MKYPTKRMSIILIGMMHGLASQAANGPFAGREMQLVNSYPGGVYPSSLVKFTVPPAGTIQFDWITDTAYRAAPITVRLSDTGSNTGTVTFVETLPTNGNYAPSPNLALFSFSASQGMPPLKAVTLDTSTTSILFDPSRVQFSDTMFSYDFGDLAIINGGFIKLNITTVSAVPEPNQWTLLLLGFGIIGYSHFARRNLMQRHSSY